MAMIYLIWDRTAAAFCGIEPTKARALEVCKDFEDAEVQTEDVTMTREGVCEFINRRFGANLFEY